MLTFTPQDNENRTLAMNYLVNKTIYFSISYVGQI